MRIRFGQPKQIKVTRDRVPNNYGMADHVNREIDYLVDSANNAYETALAADGVEFMLWRRTNEGRLCSCKHVEEQNTPSDSRFEEFNTHSKTEFERVNEVNVRGSWDRQRIKPNVHGKELGVEIGLVKNEDGSDAQTVKDYPAIDQREIDAFLNGPLDARFLEAGTGTTFCGICFGTGYTNGYSLFNGTRVVFDAQNQSRTKGFRINRDEHPWKFQAQGDQRAAYVEWEWETPAFFKDATAINIRNNLDKTRGFRLTAMIDNNGEYVPLNKDFINSLQGTSHKIKIRLDIREASTTDVEFTHVEFVIQYSNWPKTQVGQLQKATNFSTAESVSTLEFNLPPSINDLSDKDVIYDMKYQKAWQITDVSDLQTAKHRVLSWTVNARSLTSFDQLSLLKLSVYPNYELSYKGLDRNND